MTTTTNTMINHMADPVAVADAIRRLIEVATAEDVSLINRLGHWPDEVQNSDLGAATIHPVAFACRQLTIRLTFHLGTLIGQDAAQAQLDALIAEQRSTQEGRDALAKVAAAPGKGRPSAPNSIQ
jgi:hypothetical protein